MKNMADVCLSGNTKLTPKVRTFTLTILQSECWSGQIGSWCMSLVPLLQQRKQRLESWIWE